MTLRKISLILFALFLSVEANAQTQGGDPQNSLLPEINPQDIEIRSEFKARFPGLRRQPILGFNPKPRVFRIDPNRMPFMETRDEAVANIAISELDRPTPPLKTLLKTPPRTTGYVKAGIGTFITPELQGYLYSGINEKSSISGNVDYRSSDGHLSDQQSGFRYLDGNAGFNSQLNEDTRLTVSGGVLSDFNRMYNLDPIFQGLIGETAKKEYLGFGIKGTIVKTENALEGWDLNVSANVFDVDLDAGSGAQTGEVKEQVFESAFSKNWAGKKLYETFHLNISARTGNYESSTVQSQEWLDLLGSLEYRKLINFSTHISANAGLAYISDGFSKRLYFAPEVKVRYNLKDAVVITGKAFGAPTMTTSQEHHSRNRFLDTNTILKHSYTSGVYGEIAFQVLEGNRLFGGISYELTKDYAYYQRSTQTVVGSDFSLFYDTNYDKATVFELFGGITQQLVAEKFWFDARFYARRPKLSGTDIPFEERLGLNGSLSYKPMDKVTISSWAEYIGKREAPSATEDLKAFALLSGEAEYQISNSFGVYLKVLNILGQKYEVWHGYEERPFQVFGGLTFKF
ncbi:MAG: hypothetical protein RLN81_06260 [Balneolaceae bacterium]